MRIVGLEGHKLFIVALQDFVVANGSLRQTVVEGQLEEVGTKSDGLAQLVECKWKRRLQVVFEHFIEVLV